MLLHCISLLFFTLFIPSLCYSKLAMHHFECKCSCKQHLLYGSAKVGGLLLQAQGCTHAFLWPWEPEKWPGKDMGQQPVPHLVENTFLLYVLNGLLSCTAVLMQPLWSPNGSVAKPKERLPASVRAAQRGQGNTKAPSTTTLEMEAPVSIGLVPLPLRLAEGGNKKNGAVHCKGVLLKLPLLCLTAVPVLALLCTCCCARCRAVSV